MSLVFLKSIHSLMFVSPGVERGIFSVSIVKRQLKLFQGVRILFQLIKIPKKYQTLL